jgi:hypothetical protein
MANVALATGRRAEVVGIPILTVPGICGEAITGGRAVVPHASTGKWYGGKADAAGTADVVGVAMRSAVAEEPLTVMVIGFMAGWDFTDQDFGEMVFLSDTGGGVLEDAAGTVAVQIGIVVPAFADAGRDDKILMVNVHRAATTAP